MDGREHAGRALILVGLGVAVGVALRDPELPTFLTERPSYGVVELRFDEVDENGAASGGTLISDGRLENIDWDVESDLADFELRRTTSGTFLRTDGAWVPFEEDDEFRADLDAIALLPVFDDVVPAEARRFTRVVELEPDVLGGRDVTRLDLVIDDRRFESAERERFAEWAGFMGDLEQPDGARSPGVGVTVWVCPDGVVWRFDSESEITSSRSTADVVRIGDEDFTVEPPRNVAR